MNDGIPAGYGESFRSGPEPEVATHLCPAHPAWGTLTKRERAIWQLGYDWGYRDAYADFEFEHKLGEWADDADEDSP